MPIQAPQWTEFLTCPVCCNEFDGNTRSPISLACAHTVCKTCLANLHKKQCPFDQTVIKTEVSGLPVNGALLQLVSGGSCSNDVDEVPPCLANLPQDQLDAYHKAKRAVEELALYLKPGPSVYDEITITSAAGECSVVVDDPGSVDPLSADPGSGNPPWSSASSSLASSRKGTRCSGGSGGGLVSRSMQRKLVTLVNCQLAEEEGRCRAMRAARSLGDRTVTELILHHQNPQHLSANLWAAVRARGCQFLGPAMQEEVLKLVLLALEDGTALSRKVLVMFVVQRLEPHFPQASKTSIGHVVQLLYRASCFKVSKREGDSSLMQLKEEFRGYEALRREHDAQIVQIATEAGLRIAPDQWSALLYGDTAHKSHMQSIMDKLQSPQSFAQSVQELVIALQRTADPGNLSSLRPHLEHLAAIDPNPEVVAYSMSELARGLEACRVAVAGLVDFMRVHGGSKGALTSCPGGAPCAAAGSALGGGDHIKYKVSLCRDLLIRGTCPRGPNCTFAHSGDELDKFRSKNRKGPRTSISRDDDFHHDDLFCCGDANDYPTFPHVQNAAYQASQHAFPAAPANPYTPEIFGSPTHGVIMTPGRSYPDFPPPPVMPSPEVGRAHPKPIWRQQHIHNPKRVASSLAVLHHRKQELLNQLERVVAQCNNNPLRNDIPGTTANYSVWNSSSLVHNSVMEPPVSAMPSSHPVLFRSDSLLTDEEFIPFDPPIVSKYGPISRDGTSKIGPPSNYADANNPTARNSVTWVYNNPQGTYPTHVIRGNESYIALPQAVVDSSHIVHQPSLYQDVTVPKDFLVESQKMKQQLRSLEKKINDLKLATESTAAFTEGEKLTQELQMIEQGIREREKQLRLFLAQEESYEEGIANDIRELELRWENELEEQEKRWSSEEETSKK